MKMLQRQLNWTLQMQDHSVVHKKLFDAKTFDKSQLKKLKQNDFFFKSIHFRKNSKIPESKIYIKKEKFQSEIKC